MAEGAEGGFPYPFFLGLEYSAAFCAGEAENCHGFAGWGMGELFHLPLGRRERKPFPTPPFSRYLTFPQVKNKKKPRRSMNFSGAGNSGARNRTRTCDLHRVKVAL